MQYRFYKQKQNLYDKFNKIIKYKLNKKSVISITNKKPAMWGHHRFQRIETLKKLSIHLLSVRSHRLSRKSNVTNI